MTQRAVEYEAVIRADDPNQFVHIVTTDLDQGIVDLMANFTATLSDIGLEVSTGPVVDFRLKNDLRALPEKGGCSAPLCGALSGRRFPMAERYEKTERH